MGIFQKQGTGQACLIPTSGPPLCWTQEEEGEPRKRRGRASEPGRLNKVSSSLSPAHHLEVGTAGRRVLWILALRSTPSFGAHMGSRPLSVTVPAGCVGDGARPLLPAWLRNRPGEGRGAIGSDPKGEPSICNGTGFWNVPPGGLPPVSW